MLVVRGVQQCANVNEPLATTFCLPSGRNWMYFGRFRLTWIEASEFCALPKHSNILILQLRYELRNYTQKDVSEHLHTDDPGTRPALQSAWLV